MSDFAPDKAVGFAVVLLSVACCVPASVGTGFAGRDVYLVASLVLLIAAAGLAIGVGILRGARWGFMLGTTVSAAMLLTHLSLQDLREVSTSGGLLAYCVLRLSGRFGPKPE